MKSARHTLETGLTVLDLFDASAPSADMEWIKVTPRGAFVARDGRSFITPPEDLVKRFNADGVAIPIDVDHSTTRRAPKGEAAPAVGWIEKLQARPDGLYGRVTWLAEGRRILAARSHRYISPTLQSDGNGRAVWLHSAALVAAPAVSMPAVASAGATEKEYSDMDVKPLTDLLGLSAGASIEDILAAVISLKAVSENKGGEKVAAAYEGLAAGLAEELRGASRDRKKKKIEEAVAFGVIPPALQEWAEDLITADEKRWDAFAAKAGTPLAYLRKSAISEQQVETLYANFRREQTVPAGAAAAVARNLGIDPKALD